MLHDKSSMIAFDGEGVEGGITGSVNVEATVTVSSPPEVMGVTEAGVGGIRGADVTEAVVYSGAEVFKTTLCQT